MMFLSHAAFVVFFSAVVALLSVLVGLVLFADGKLKKGWHATVLCATCTLVTAIILSALVFPGEIRRAKEAWANLETVPHRLGELERQLDDPQVGDLAVMEGEIMTLCFQVSDAQQYCAPWNKELKRLSTEARGVWGQIRNKREILAATK